MKKDCVNVEEFLVGYCPVDSGQLLIVDPCYLDTWKSGKFGDENDYNECCEVTIANGAGPVFGGKAVVSNTAIGDGLYPIYLVFKGDLPARIEVRFDDGPMAELFQCVLNDSLNDNGGDK
jgi:hypothetical protein